MFIDRIEPIHFSPVGTICLSNVYNVNISSLSNQRQMCVWHLAGLRSLLDWIYQFKENILFLVCL